MNFDGRFNFQLHSRFDSNFRVLWTIKINRRIDSKFGHPFTVFFGVSFRCWTPPRPWLDSLLVHTLNPEGRPSYCLGSFYFLPFRFACLYTFVYQFFVIVDIISILSLKILRFFSANDTLSSEIFITISSTYFPNNSIFFHCIDSLASFIVFLRLSISFFENKYFTPTYKCDNFFFIGKKLFPCR